MWSVNCKGLFILDAVLSALAPVAGFFIRRALAADRPYLRAGGVAAVGRGLPDRAGDAPLRAIARDDAAGAGPGFHITFWATFALLVIGIAILITLFLISKVRLRPPNLDA